MTPDLRRDVPQGEPPRLAQRPDPRAQLEFGRHRSPRCERRSASDDLKYRFRPLWFGDGARTRRCEIRTDGALTPGGVTPTIGPPVARLQGRRSAPIVRPRGHPLTASLTPGTGSESPSLAGAPDERAIQGIRPATRRDQPRRRDHRRHEAVRDGDRRRPHEPAHRPRRVLQPPRPVRLRQDHDAAHDRRLRAADGGRDPARRTADRRCPAVQAQRQHGLPALRALPAHGRRPQRRLRPAPDEGRQVRGGPSRQRRPRDGPPRGLRAAPHVGDVRRPAAARRAREGPGQPPHRAPPRRAAGRARPEAPQGDAARAQGPPARGRHHVRLRDPRPGGGAHDERRHRGHARRAHPADGRSDRAVRTAGQPLRRRFHRHVELPAGHGRIRSTRRAGTR